MVKVLHRDLKHPMYSYLRRSSKSNFGLASFTESKSKKADEIGKLRTVEYAALEAAGGVRGDDVRSDVFFLGALLYLIFSGRSPFKESREREVRADPKRYAEIEPLGRVAPHLPRDLVDVVNKMLSLKPKHRFQTVLEVHEAFKPIQLRCAEDESTITPDSP